MTTKNPTGAALTVAEKNGQMLEQLVYAKGVVGAALGALAECADVNAANRLLRKTCEEVRDLAAKCLEGGEK